MCGLVGVAGIPSGMMDKMFKTLLVLDVVRGEDSTGVLLVDSSGDSEIHKVVGNPYGLFDSRLYTHAMSYANNVLMGHNRWATKGVVNKMNAHPFEHGHLIGAHNGTLSTQYLLDDNKEYDVDSDNIFHHMELNGVNETCKLLGGHFALSWYDSKEETINFVRNSSRPLHGAYTSDGLNVVWASEAWMLTVAADKANVSLEPIFEFGTHTHYSLEIPCGLCKDYPFLDSFKVTEVEAYVPPKKSTVTTLTSTGNSSSYVTNTTSHTQNGGSQGHFNLINTWTDFKVIGTHPKYKHMIEIQLDGMSDIKARVICKRSSSTYRELLAGVGKLFCGLVSKVGHNSVWSVNIKGNTVSEVWEEDVLEVKLPIGQMGEMASLSDWRGAVQSGCSWCSDVPQHEEEAQRLVWISSTEYVCPHCAADEEVKKYLYI